METVEPLASEPAVQDVIATEVTDVLERQVGIEATLNDVFSDVVTARPELERLIRPLQASGHRGIRHQDHGESATSDLRARPGHRCCGSEPCSPAEDLRLLLLELGCAQDTLVTQRGQFLGSWASLTSMPPGCPPGAGGGGGGGGGAS